VRGRSPSSAGSDDLHTLEKNTFRYFWDEANPDNGLIADNTASADVPASIAGVGLALACYPAGVERAWVTRAQAAQRALVTAGRTCRA